MLRPLSGCLQANAWICPDYWSQDSDHILTDLRQHVTICALALLFGALTAVPLTLLARRNRWLRGTVLALTGVIYTIPSLALFVLLGPVFGVYLSDKPVITALALYNLQILVRNALVGLEGVPPEVVDAARGMGFTRARTLWRVELPLALPSIVAGLRIAAVSTVALATVGIAVGSGGLGGLIYEGFAKNDFHAEIATGLGLVVALGLALELVLLGVQRILTPWARA